MPSIGQSSYSTYMRYSVYMNGSLTFAYGLMPPTNGQMGTIGHDFGHWFMN